MPSFRNLKRYVALKIKVNFQTGERAGGIDPYDAGLYCLAQNLEDGYEIRLVLDDRDIDKYRNIEGVEVIEGICLLYTSPSPRDISGSRMPSSA